MRLNLLARTPYEPDDELDGSWTREQLEQMDAAFTTALEQAFTCGLESRASAAGQVQLKPTLGPRWTTPLTREIQEALWRSAASSALVFIAR